MADGKREKFTGPFYQRKLIRRDGQSTEMDVFIVEVAAVGAHNGAGSI